MYKKLNELSELNRYEMETMIKELPEDKQLFLFRYVMGFLKDERKLSFS